MEIESMRYKPVKGHPGIKLDTTTGKYMANVTINKKRNYKTFCSLREAKYWRKNFHPILAPSPKQSNPLRSSIKGNGNNKNITIYEVFEKYKKLKLPSLGEVTRDKKVPLLENFLDGIMDYALSELNPEFIGNYILNKKEEALIHSPQRYSFDRELKEFSSVLNWYSDAVDDGFKNPIKQFHKDLGRIKKKPKTDKKIPAEDIVNFIDAFKPNQQLYKDMAILQYFCASRIGEIAGINIGNIDLVNKKLTIKDVVTWPKGKEHRMDRKGKIREMSKLPKIKEYNKTDDIKVVHIVDSMLEIINRRISLVPKGCNLLFHRNGKPLRYNSIQEAYNKALKASESKYSGTHIMRHGMATTTRGLLTLDHSQSVTGHKSVRMLEHYAENKNFELNKTSVIEVEKFLDRIKSRAKNGSKWEQGQDDECKVVDIRG